MKKKNKLIKILAIMIGFIIIVFIFFRIPYSMTRSSFKKTYKSLNKELTDIKGTFTEEEIAALPTPVKKYFRYCGFLGTPKMSSIKAEFKNVAFVQGKGGPSLNIDYTLYDYADSADRIAYINSSMYGIPFEGFDSYVNGCGGMKGVVAKLFTIFNYKGARMDKAALVTVLSESLLIPSNALQDYITWESIDDTHAKAVISKYGISAEGIFTFDDNGEMLSFTTEDRGQVNKDGSVEYIKWSAVCSDYIEDNGIRRPKKFQAIWHYDDGDLIYFDGKDMKIEYVISK